MKQKPENKMKPQETNIAFPTAEKWVKSPLRNHIKIELNVPINEVWTVVGNPAKILTYSSGLNKIETKTDASGKCSEYTCFYESDGESKEEIIHAKMLWHEANKGWASLDEEPNAFGFQQSLVLITVEQKDNKTILNWDMHYNNESDEMLQMYITSLEQALSDEIGQQLIQKFGGRILEKLQLR